MQILKNQNNPLYKISDYLKPTDFFFEKKSQFLTNFGTHFFYECLPKKNYALTRKPQKKKKFFHLFYDKKNLLKVKIKKIKKNKRLLKKKKK